MQLHPLNTLCNNSSLPQFSPSVPFYLLSLPLHLRLLPLHLLVVSFSSSLYPSLSCLTPSLSATLTLSSSYTIKAQTQTACSTSFALPLSSLPATLNRSQPSLLPGAFLGFFFRQSRRKKGWKVGLEIIQRRNS